MSGCKTAEIRNLAARSGVIIETAAHQHGTCGNATMTSGRVEAAAGLVLARYLARDPSAEFWPRHATTGRTVHCRVSLSGMSKARINS